MTTKDLAMYPDLLETEFIDFYLENNWGSMVYATNS